MTAPGGLGAALGLSVALGACVLGSGRSCSPDGSGDDPDRMAASLRGAAYVGVARTEGAAAFLYEPASTSLGEEAILVLCVGDTATSGGSVYQPFLSGERAATAVRIGASSTGADGVLAQDPGHVFVRVNDESIAELEVEWTNALGTSQRRSWSTPISKGLRLVPLPAGVPIDALMWFRFLDAAGETVSAQPGQ